MWIFSLTSCCAWSTRLSSAAAEGLRHISLNRLTPATEEPMPPTTIGTSLALKCQGSAAITKPPITAMIEHREQLRCGWNVGRLEACQRAVPMPPCRRMSARNGRTRPTIAMVSRMATTGRVSQEKP